MVRGSFLRGVGLGGGGGGWNRVPDSRGLEPEGTLAKRFGVRSGD